ncbi:MAG: hypothetical protein ACE5D6_06595 [Candidatus Zixiibacteriota bacterium]
MLNNDLLIQVKNLAEDATKKADEYTGIIGSVQNIIIENFGMNGLYAAYLVLAAVILLIVSKLAKLSFSAVKYLIIPSLALAFLGTFFVPYSFVALLPVTVTVCSLFLLFKG